MFVLPLAQVNMRLTGLFINTRNRAARDDTTNAPNGKRRLGDASLA